MTWLLVITYPSAETAKPLPDDAEIISLLWVGVFATGAGGDSLFAYWNSPSFQMPSFTVPLAKV